MKIVSYVLQVIGALALLFVGTIAVWLYFFSPFLPHKRSGKDEAVFVLNWAGLNPAQQWRVIDSTVSERNITGDHTDYYCIQLENIEIDERNRDDWKPGPEANPLTLQALEEALQWAQMEGAKCMPTFERANSRAMDIMFWSMTTHGRQPTAAKILLLEPSTRRLFYVSYKT